MRLLLIRLGSLGDLVHGLPVAAALRDRFPAARIDWLVDVRHAAFLDLVPVLDGRLVVGRRVAGRVLAPGWLDLLAAIASTRRGRYDAAIDLQGLLKSAVLARLSGARRVIGFDRSGARETPASFFYTERVTTAGAHVVDKNLSLLGAFGIAGAPRRFPIDVPDSRAASEAWDALREDGAAGRPAYALLNAGAAWPNKRWPPERFGAAARWLRDRHDLRSLVVWGPGEEPLAEVIVRTAGGAALQAPPTGVGDFLALARSARLVLSGDTGPLHLAAAVGTPIVALFGPTDPARNGPWNSADLTLSRFDACVCHYQRHCRRGRACIEEISVEDVCGAIERRLATNAAHA